MAHGEALAEVAAMTRDQAERALQALLPMHRFSLSDVEFEGQTLWSVDFSDVKVKGENAYIQEVFHDNFYLDSVVGEAARYFRPIPVKLYLRTPQ
jgi:hypothetical protein